MKLASTGWRFARYYTRSSAYVAHGPPQMAMRLLAPLLVVATVVLFGSGVAMGLLHGNALQIARRLHGPASVIWLLLLGLHVLVYLGRALRDTAGDVGPADPAPVRGKAARRYALATAVVCGLVLGGALVPAQYRSINIRHDHNDREGQSAARKRPSSQTQSQRPQFSTTGSAMPIAAVWTRRIEPPCVTTRTRPSGMALGDPPQRGEDPLPVRLGRSPTNSTRRARTAVSPSQVPQSFSRRPGSSVDRQPEPLGRRSRPSRAPARGRSRRSPSSCSPASSSASCSRLPPAEVAQRPVGVTLQPPLGVPVGLAVANEQQGRHDRYASQPWTSGSPTTSASSPARPAGSASRPRSCCAPRARPS